MSKKEPGRPTKLNAETVGKITDALYIGASRDVAAVYGGITKQTFYVWLREGRDAREAGNRGKKAIGFINFLTEVEKAEAEACIKWQQVVDKAAERDPIWAYRMLTVRDARNYRESVDITTGGERITDYRDAIISKLLSGKSGADK